MYFDGLGSLRVDLRHSHGAEFVVRLAGVGIEALVGQPVHFGVVHRHVDLAWSDRAGDEGAARRNPRLQPPAVGGLLRSRRAEGRI